MSHKKKEARESHQAHMGGGSIKQYQEDFD